MPTCFSLFLCDVTGFCSYQIVESMRMGMDPQTAAENVIKRIAKYYPNFEGGVIAVNKTGHFG